MPEVDDLTEEEKRDAKNALKIGGGVALLGYGVATGNGGAVLGGGILAAEGIAGLADGYDYSAPPIP